MAFETDSDMPHPKQQLYVRGIPNLEPQEAAMNPAISDKPYLQQDFDDAAYETDYQEGSHLISDDPFLVEQPRDEPYARCLIQRASRIQSL